MHRTLAAATISIAAFVAPAALAQILPNGPDTGYRELRPGVRTLRHGDQVGRVFGVLSTGATPADSARAFIATDSGCTFCRPGN